MARLPTLQRQVSADVARDPGLRVPDTGRFAERMAGDAAGLVQTIGDIFGKENEADLSTPDPEQDMKSKVAEARDFDQGETAKLNFTQDIQDFLSSIVEDEDADATLKQFERTVAESRTRQLAGLSDAQQQNFTERFEPAVREFRKEVERLTVLRDHRKLLANTERNIGMLEQMFVAGEPLDRRMALEKSDMLLGNLHSAGVLGDTDFEERKAHVRETFAIADARAQMERSPRELLNIRENPRFAEIPFADKEVLHRHAKTRVAEEVETGRKAIQSGAGEIKRALSAGARVPGAALTVIAPENIAKWIRGADRQQALIETYATAKAMETDVALVQAMSNADLKARERELNQAVLAVSGRTPSSDINQSDGRDKDEPKMPRPPRRPQASVRPSLEDQDLPVSESSKPGERNAGDEQQGALAQSSESGHGQDGSDVGRADQKPEDQTGRQMAVAVVSPANAGKKKADFANDLRRQLDAHLATGGSAKVLASEFSDRKIREMIADPAEAHFLIAHRNFAIALRGDFDNLPNMTREEIDQRKVELKISLTDPHMTAARLRLAKDHRNAFARLVAAELDRRAADPLARAFEVDPTPETTGKTFDFEQAIGRETGTKLGVAYKDFIGGKTAAEFNTYMARRETALNRFGADAEEEQLIPERAVDDLVLEFNDRMLANPRDAFSEFAKLAGATGRERVRFLRQLAVNGLDENLVVVAAAHRRDWAHERIRSIQEAEQISKPGQTGRQFRSHAEIIDIKTARIEERKPAATLLFDLALEIGELFKDLDDKPRKKKFAKIPKELTDFLKELAPGSWQEYVDLHIEFRFREAGLVGNHLGPRVSETLHRTIKMIALSEMEKDVDPFTAVEKAADNILGDLTVIHDREDFKIEAEPKVVGMVPVEANLNIEHINRGIATLTETVKHVIKGGHIDELPKLNLKGFPEDIFPKPNAGQMGHHNHTVNKQKYAWQYVLTHFNFVITDNGRFAVLDMPESMMMSDLRGEDGQQLMISIESLERLGEIDTSEDGRAPKAPSKKAERESNKKEKRQLATSFR